LVDLPGDGFFTRSLDDSNIDGDDDLISGGFQSARIIVVDDSNTWSAGDTIQFEINVGSDGFDEGADFRDPPDLENDDAEADKLEVIIVHTPSDTIISEHTFRP
jgi:hypothetical protein